MASGPSHRVERGRTQLISRNGNTFGAFQMLQQSIGASLRKDSAVLDGEIVCLDRKGKSRFNDLLFRRGDLCFFAFDLLFVNGQDLRTLQLCDRKHELRRVPAGVPADFRVFLLTKKPLIAQIRSRFRFRDNDYAAAEQIFPYCMDARNESGPLPSPGSQQAGTCARSTITPSFVINYGKQPRLNRMARECGSVPV